MSVLAIFIGMILSVPLSVVAIIFLNWLFPRKRWSYRPNLPRQKKTRFPAWPEFADDDV